MKYILMCAGAVLCCFALGSLPVHFLKKKIARQSLRILLSMGIGTVLLLAVGLAYVLDFYRADSTALEALRGTEAVTVTPVEGGYFFDGPGTDTALIFYPGAKVAAESYAGLMLRIAENGEDCFLARMPLNMAMLHANAADAFISKYEYAHWDLAGHSMGGVVAANYAVNTQNRIERLFLLAAYPYKPVTDSIPLISIYGDCDGCLDMAAYEASRSNFPANWAEYVISGGNHSQMGSYGFQKGDLEASITPEAQWQQVADLITAQMP